MKVTVTLDIPDNTLDAYTGELVALDAELIRLVQTAGQQSPTTPDGQLTRGLMAIYQKAGGAIKRADEVNGFQSALTSLITESAIQGAKGEIARAVKLINRRVNELQSRVSVSMHSTAFNETAINTARAALFKTHLANRIAGIQVEAREAGRAATEAALSYLFNPDAAEAKADAEAIEV